MFSERIFNNLLLNKRLHHIFLVLFLGLMSADIVRHFGTANFEMGVIIDLTIALVLAFFLILSKSRLRQHANTELELQNNMLTLRVELEGWKQRSQIFVKEFENIISAHFDVWSLTNAEKDVALLLVKGMSFSEIATIRGTTSNTVRNQAHSIYSKSQLKSRTELAAYFMEELLNK